jgi:hypothetical protein
MDPQYSTFLFFSVASVCPMLRKRWLQASGASAKALYLWFWNVFMWLSADNTCAFLQAASCTRVSLYRASISSVTPAHVFVMSRTRRHDTRQLHMLTVHLLQCG